MNWKQGLWRCVLMCFSVITTVQAMCIVILEGKKIRTSVPAIDDNSNKKKSGEMM